MNTFGAKDCYKYVNQTENKMKIDVTQENEREILETKLNGRDVIKGMKTWAVSLLSYTSSYLKRMSNQRI